jgi:hypothetical protein
MTYWPSFTRAVTEMTMATINFKRMRELLADFQFQRLFVDELGWSQPISRLPVRLDVKGVSFSLRHREGHQPEGIRGYYTRPEITEYLCERTIHRLVLDAVNTAGIPGVVPARQFETLADLVLGLDADLCRRLLLSVLPKLSLLDPPCGSGAFLVAAMKTLINIYAAIIGKIKFVNDATLTRWPSEAERTHASLSYFIKKTIPTLRENVVQVVAAFLNSKEGGALLIGVASDTSIEGLADDFRAANSQKPGRDSYELFLRDLLGSQLGREHADSYSISLHVLGGKEICRISIQPAAKPVYLNGDFYLRDGKKKSKLKAKEAAEYIKVRWGRDESVALDQDKIRRGSKRTEAR